MKDNWRERPSIELINACDKRVDPLREATYRLEAAELSIALRRPDRAKDELEKAKSWVHGATSTIPLFSEQAAIFIKHVEELEPLVDKPLEFEERLEQLGLMPRMIGFYMTDFVSCLCGH